MAQKLQIVVPTQTHVERGDHPCWRKLSLQWPSTRSNPSS